MQFQPRQNTTITSCSADNPPSKNLPLADPHAPMLDHPKTPHHGRGVKKILLPIVLVLFIFGPGACNVFGETKEIAELRKKANAGDAFAQSHLGWAYSEGEGVRKDDVAAYAWFNLAALNGTSFSALQARDDLAKEMTPEQIAKAQELSKELLKKIEAKKNK